MLESYLAPWIAQGGAACDSQLSVSIGKFVTFYMSLKTTVLKYFVCFVLFL